MATLKQGTQRPGKKVHGLIANPHVSGLRVLNWSDAGHGMPIHQLLLKHVQTAPREETERMFGWGLGRMEWAVRVGWRLENGVVWPGVNSGLRVVKPQPSKPVPSDWPGCLKGAWRLTQSSQCSKFGACENPPASHPPSRLPSLSNPASNLLANAQFSSLDLSCNAAFAIAISPAHCAQDPARTAIVARRKRNTEHPHSLRLAHRPTTQDTLFSFETPSHLNRDHVHFQGSPPGCCARRAHSFHPIHWQAHNSWYVRHLRWDMGSDARGQRD
jgi:hypothetical protein